MKTEIINTGTELLLGNVVNTHLPYLAKQLFALGVRVDSQTTAPDGNFTRDAIQAAISRNELLFVTGGLGPTTDDLTREITAELLKLPLLHDDSVEQKIRERCQRRGYPFRERMLRQCLIPQGAQVLPNDFGTAPGIYIPTTNNSPHLFLLPGPPRELIPMFESQVLPRLKKILPNSESISEHTYRIIGLGESTVEEMIGLQLDAIPNLEVGYCARPNEVDLRLIGPKGLLAELHPQIEAKLGENIAGEGEITLEEIVVKLLQETHSTLSTAESCTGGLLGHRLTNVSGASEVFTHGFITYSNEAKSQLLNISPQLIEKYGAVSEPVAAAMAEGAKKTSGSHYALALTGIAGPTGGSKEKPIGTVFIAMASPKESVQVIKKHFESDRETFKNLSSQAALDLLRRQILKDKKGAGHAA
ncbi:MAG: competence/damage-inducible protein A [Chthoniobacterales bacterium]